MISMASVFSRLEFKGNVHKKKNLYYSFDCDENLHTHVKSKMKWGNSHDFFFYFLHRK